MTLSEILKEFFSNVVLPVAIAVFLYFLFYPICMENGKVDFYYLWILCGIPFGIRRMFVWLIPQGYDLGGTLGIYALNFIVGGIIGGFILTWRLVKATWYFILTIFRLISLFFI